MNDTLNYFRTDPTVRESQRGQLTFSMDYFFRERYLLPLSTTSPSTEKPPFFRKCTGIMKTSFPRGGPSTST